MTSVIVTNVLDLVAFFMVTIDLYGRQRFEEVAKRLDGAQVTRIDFGLFWRRPGHLNLPIDVQAFWFANLCLILSAILVFTVGGHGFWDSVSTFWHNSWIVWLSSAVTWIVFSCISYFFWLLRQIAKTAIMYLLKIYRLDGVLVSLGALLFALSRFYAMYIAVKGGNVG